MSKLHIDEVLVVEGKMDKQLLEQYIDGDIITTNGSAVSDELIFMLKELIIATSLFGCYGNTKTKHNHYKPT